MKSISKITPFFTTALAVLLSYAVVGQQILVRPYIQPGDASDLKREKKVLIWETDNVTGDFEVIYFSTSGKDNESAKIIKTTLFVGKSGTLLYRARMDKLNFDEEYNYRVSLNGKTIYEDKFKTRTTGKSTAFAVMGDCGQGTKEQLEIARQIKSKQPQFVLVTGDDAYPRGRYQDYRKNFFPYYNDTVALMNTVPFYMIAGNHDVMGDNLDKDPGGLAYFYYNDLPLNAPVPEHTLVVAGDERKVQDFKKNAKPRFPGMLNFSFDYGNVHFTCLDANAYTNPLDPELLQWIESDLKKTKAVWKIAVYHHPAFNSSNAHYNDQYMRLLSPHLERLGVQLVLNGHVHNYQRTAPLKFTPALDSTGTKYVVSPEGRIDGSFAIDQEFNGINNTKPSGIIYIVSGAGGAALYDKRLSEKPALWKHEPANNWAPYTVKLISHVHSFTWIETTETDLNLSQIDRFGNKIDEIKITR